MVAKLDHTKLTDILVRNGFYQTVQHVTGGWFHKCGLVAYYINHKNTVYYTVRYQLDSHDVKTVRELNDVLTKYKNKKILQ